MLRCWYLRSLRRVLRGLSRMVRVGKPFLSEGTRAELLQMSNTMARVVLAIEEDAGRARRTENRWHSIARP